MRITELLAVALAVLPARGQTLAGKVVEDHSGSPLASVELRVAKDGVRQLVANLETDGAGSFRAEGVPASEYRVDVSKPNYAPLTLRIRLGADSKPLAIRMVRYGVISGRVADADGRTPPGVRINVMTRGLGGAMIPFGYSVTPDESGRYRRFNLPPGEYAVAASYGASSALVSSGGAGLKSAAGSGVMFYPDSQRPRWFTVAGGEDYANTDFIIMTAGLFSVSGTVEPAGVMYAVSLVPVEQPALATASARLDPKTGAFQFDGIPPGTYDLFALGPVRGYGGQGVILGADAVYGRVRVVVVGQDVQELKIATGKGRSASFILRMAPGQSASACPPNASLSLLPMEAAGVGASLKVEANFVKPQVVNDLAPIRYRVAVGRLGETCYSSGQLLDLTSAVDDPVVITVMPAATVRGRVAGPEGEFLIVLVASEPADSAEAVLVAYPDTQRRFSFTGLRPGRYRIGVFPAAEASKARWVADMVRMTELDLNGGVTEIDVPSPAEEPM